MLDALGSRLGVGLTHLVESRDLFFLEAEIVCNIFSGMY